MSVNVNDSNKPDLYWYKPVSIEEFIDAVAENASEDILDGDVPWKEYLAFCKAEITEILENWASKQFESGAAELVIKGTKANGLFLDKVRSLVLGLSTYSEIQNYFLWIQQQQNRMSSLEARSLIWKLSNSVDIKISNLRAELEEVRLTGGIEHEIENLELKLLKFYEAEVMKLCHDFARSENKSKRKNSPFHGIKPERRKITRPYDYEKYCADWLKYLGASHVNVTVASNDGGIDITASGIVAQVKFYNKPVGVSDVRNLFGAASSAKCRAVFFTSMAYSERAIEFANTNKIALLVVDNFDGTIIGANAYGVNAVRQGF